MPAPQHVVGQPEKLLVAKPANLLDLILSQHALLQPGTPVVALQHLVLGQSVDGEGSRLAGLPLPNVDFLIMRAIEKVEEALPALEFGLKGLDLGGEAPEGRAAACDLPSGLGQFLAGECGFVVAQQRPSDGQGILGLVGDIRLLRRSLTGEPTNASRYQHERRGYHRRHGERTAIPPRELAEAIPA